MDLLYLHYKFKEYAKVDFFNYNIHMSGQTLLHEIVNLTIMNIQTETKKDTNIMINN